jgi:curved DNA-binding protein CbpA
MDLQNALKVFSLETLEGLTPDKLKAKYRRLAKQTHPDSEGGNSQEFVKLRQAFLFLSKHLEKNPAKDLKEDGVTDLETLSKDEIVSKYVKETQVLQSQLALYASAFQEQDQIMQQVKEKVENILAHFDRQKVELHEELEKEISKLEKNYSSNLLKKIFFFWPQMSEHEFWKHYHSRIDNYSRKHNQLDLEFFRSMVEAYGSGLNRIATLTGPKEVQTN